MATIIYFAGPDIFHPDFSRYREQVQNLCSQAGLTPLSPGDLHLDQARDIFTHNLKLIDQADGLIANLNPFRGPVEPDSGTVFECAYAYARKKFIIGLVADQRDILSKLKAAGAGPPEGMGHLCPDGFMVENFGQPLNLMLAEALTGLAANLEEAVKMAQSLSATGTIRPKSR